MNLEINDAEKRLHRTWVQLLLDSGYNEIASIAVDADIHITSAVEEVWHDYGATHITVRYRVTMLISTSSYNYVMLNEDIQAAMKWAMQSIADEQQLPHLYPETIPVDDCSPNRCNVSGVEYAFGVKAIEPEPDWQDQVRRLILGPGINNQGRISEIAMGKRQEQPIVYNEMRFASQSEVRIAQALERKGVLFFPLPLTVRHTTGNKWQDHKEADFLVCDNSKWGILEVAFHPPERYEKDAEKSDWWKESGILCVQHYTAERCYHEPDKVVSEFLNILSKY